MAAGKGRSQGPSVHFQGLPLGPGSFHRGPSSAAFHHLQQSRREGISPVPHGALWTLEAREREGSFKGYHRALCKSGYEERKQRYGHSWTVRLLASASGMLLLSIVVLYETFSCIKKLMIVIPQCNSILFFRLVLWWGGFLCRAATVFYLSLLWKNGLYGDISSGTCYF